MPKDLIRIDVDDGKYTVVQPEGGQSYILRYGEEWLGGDNVGFPGANCVLAMAYELEELRKLKTAADNVLRHMVDGGRPSVTFSVEEFRKFMDPNEPEFVTSCPSHGGIPGGPLEKALDHIATGSGPAWTSPIDHGELAGTCDCAASMSGNGPPHHPTCPSYHPETT